MLCDICQKRPVKIYMQRVVNNEQDNIHLCAECAKSQFGKGFFTELFDPLKLVLDTLSDKLQEIEDTEGLTALTCHNCGYPLKKFTEKYLLGCSECYESFARQIEEDFANLQDRKYKGKIPQRYKPFILAVKKLEELKKDLDCAVKEERYEKAALLRDEITAFQKSMLMNKIDSYA